MPGDEQSSKNNLRLTETAEAIRLRYPDGAHDAEALVVHPTTGDLYIVTKTTESAAVVYKASAPLSISEIKTLTRVGELRVPGLFSGMITGGDISPDGLRIVLCDYLNAYEISLPGHNRDERADFDHIWKQPMTTIELGGRAQGETVCYSADGGAILATSEKLPVPLIEAVRLRDSDSTRSRNP
jgi:hypothetical protein